MPNCTPDRIITPASSPVLSLNGFDQGQVTPHAATHLCRWPDLAGHSRPQNSLQQRRRQ